MKTKIEIKSIWGKLLFEFEKEDNSIKDTLIEAIKKGTYLRGANLQGANLQGANLQDAYLLGANLMGADLQGANLLGAYLLGANLLGANLLDANLQDAGLQGANLQGADLLGADLQGANLQGADLQGADLRGANLLGANLQGANLQGTQIDNIEKHKSMFWIIPEQGAFEAWKKLENGCIAKLHIPAKAKRTCNLKNRKCRAEYVKVLEILDIYGNKVKSAYNDCRGNAKKIKYTVGQITKSDSFNDSVLEDCSHGIHFFVTKQEAINW